jgi:uncharacterized protein (UPF0261 family)
VTVLLPLRGGSMIGAPGQPFHDLEADQALYSALKANLRKDLPVIEMEAVINDPAFAEACARELLKNLAAAGRAGDAGTRPRPVSAPD